MLSPDWKAMFLPPGTAATTTTTDTSIPKHWLHWACVHSLPTQQKRSHLYYLFFSALHWPNRSRSIFQPAAFVSKQLYLLGYGLFSLALSLLFYHLSLSFGSVAYGTYDRGSRACVGNQKSMLCLAECGSKEELFAFLLK